MPVASGYSIQRNEIINIPHRQQYETHTAGGGTTQFFLRSKIDYSNKDWEWNIKVGGVRYDLDREVAPSPLKNSYTDSATDQSIWDGGEYGEGSIDAGFGSVKFDQTLGVFGALVFADIYAPGNNEILEVTYQEHESQWTGSRGGLLYQLASDMCIHPYNSPEIFKYTGEDSSTAIGLSESHSFDYSDSTTPRSPRTPSGVFKLIREYVKDSTASIASTAVSDPKVLTDNFPLTLSDLGDGEFRVSLGGRVIDSSHYTISSDDTARTSSITLTTPVSDFNWLSADSSDDYLVDVVIGFHWKHSLAVPYGAVVGTGTGNRTAFPLGGETPNFTYTAPTTGSRASITVDANGANGSKTNEQTDLDFIEAGNLLLLQFDDDEQFTPAFNLIYPKPVSSNPEDIRAALKQVTTKFLVESSKGTDLLSDDELTPISTDPTSNKTKPQNWRIRFEYSGDGAFIKVNVATEYQLLDDMTITQGQGRDGAKYPIYREPGELCDVYQEPSIGRGVTTRIQKAKSQFFTRVAKTEDEVARTYPMSYRMTVTDHGMGLFIFDQAAVDQDDDYAWFVVQRHVNQTTGQPEFSGKSPVHCVYSPTKRPLEISDLNTYYSVQDVDDLSKPKNIYDSFGRELETEAPTIFINPDDSFFNDFVNSIDFTGSYGLPLDSNDQPQYKDDLDVGFLGGAGSDDADSTQYWADAATAPVNDLLVLGFSNVGRTGQRNVLVGTNAGPSWVTDAARQSGIQLSGNVVFPESNLSAVSGFDDATTITSQVTTSGTTTTSTTPLTLDDWDDPSYALLDILYNEIAANREKVFESLVVALDGVEILRDPDAYILTYDEWVRKGDPDTVQRFLEGLDVAGVESFGDNFRLPDTMSGTNSNNAVNATPATAPGTTYKFVSDVAGGTIPTNETRSTATVSGGSWGAQFVTALDGLPDETYVASDNLVSLKGKLPGDPIFSPYGTSQLNLTAGPNRYLYDFFNQTLYFRDTPRSGSSFSMKLVNYTSSTPSETTYIVSVPVDRDLPDRNQNSTKTINRFIVRESDVLKPWDYHSSATMHEADSNSIINPQEQLSITQDRDFVFSFPTQLTSQRFYYPKSELDLIAISSADFSTQAGHIEIDKYSDSNGSSANAFSSSETTNDSALFDVGSTQTFAGHVGPDQRPYIWQRNKRKYEGMMSTEPNGNGMRVFLQVTGSSIRYSDVVEGSAP